MRIPPVSIKKETPASVEPKALILRIGSSQSSPFLRKNGFHRAVPHFAADITGEDITKVFPLGVPFQDFGIKMVWMGMACQNIELPGELKEVFMHVPVRRVLVIIEQEGKSLALDDKAAVVDVFQ